MIKRIKEKNAITLLALIITVIILLILATVSISLIINSEILDHAQQGVDKYSEEEELEQIKLAVASAQLKENGFLTTEILNSELQEKVDKNEEVDKIGDIWHYKKYVISENGNVEISALPGEYQELDYVQVPKGTEGAINTGIQNNKIGRIEISLEADYSQYQMLLYSAELNNTYRGAPYIFNTLNKVEMQGSNYTTCEIIANPISSEYINQTVKVDFTINIVSSNDKYLCFGGGTPGAWTGSVRKIYYVRIYDTSNLLLRNYIPCYKRSNNVVGMYDLVEETFNTPWTGSWSKGTDV